jgi:hypothetical protein
VRATPKSDKDATAIANYINEKEEALLAPAHNTMIIDQQP